MHGTSLPGTEAGHGREVGPLSLRDDTARVERGVHLHLVLYTLLVNVGRGKDQEKEEENDSHAHYIDNQNGALEVHDFEKVNFSNRAYLRHSPGHALHTKGSQMGLALLLALGKCNVQWL